MFVKDIFTELMIRNR